MRKKAATELAGISSWASTQEKKELTRMHKKEWRRSSISVLKLEKKLGKVVNMERERVQITFEESSSLFQRAPLPKLLRCKMQIVANLA